MWSVVRHYSEQVISCRGSLGAHFIECVGETRVCVERFVIDFSLTTLRLFRCCCWLFETCSRTAQPGLKHYS